MRAYFEELEKQLIAAARQPATSRAGSAPSRRWISRRLRAFALLVGVTIAGAVPALAATGVFTPQREADGLVRLSKRELLAQGTTRDGRDWQILGSQSDAGFCLGLRLPPEFPSGGGVVGEGCGGAEPGTFSAGSTSGGSNPKNALIHGMTPDAAKEVRATTKGIPATSVDTVDDDVGLKGRFYLLELPVRGRLPRTRVEALDDRGRVIAAQTIR